MARAKTVFVVGAGASAEADLPVGRDLAARISEIIAFEFDDWNRVTGGDESYRSRLNRRHSNDFKDYVRTARWMSAGIKLAPSIDQFMDKHTDEPKVAELGKAAIVQAILEAERNSRKLYVEGGPYSRVDFDALQKTWYVPFGRLLTADIPKPKVADVFENITIVCFNYDRCIEQFIAHYLMYLYNFPMEEGRELADTLKILRPYGKVGPINGGLPFGQDPSQCDCFGLADNIRTFTEQVGDQGEIGMIKTAMQEADAVAFIGFHFIEQNMTLLTPEKKSQAGRVFATVYERSPFEIDIIREKIEQILFNRPPNPSKGTIPIMASATCKKFFDEYGLGLDPKR